MASRLVYPVWTYESGDKGKFAVTALAATTKTFSKLVDRVDIAVSGSCYVRINDAPATSDDFLVPTGGWTPYVGPIKSVSFLSAAGAITASLIGYSTNRQD